MRKVYPYARSNARDVRLHPVSIDNGYHTIFQKTIFWTFFCNFFELLWIILIILTGCSLIAQNYRQISPSSREPGYNGSRCYPSFHYQNIKLVGQLTTSSKKVNEAAFSAASASWVESQDATLQTQATDLEESEKATKIYKTPESIRQIFLVRLKIKQNVADRVEEHWTGTVPMRMYRNR